MGRPEAEFGRHIVSANGWDIPNWVDFSGPNGMQDAYTLELATIKALKNAIRNEEDDPQYLKFEVKSHDGIVHKIELLAKQRGITLKKTVVNLSEAIGRASVGGKRRSSTFATSFGGRVNDKPASGSKILYKDLIADFMRSASGRAAKRLKPELRYIGKSQAHSSCDRCGKTGLVETSVFERRDGTRTYMGSECAKDPEYPVTGQNKAVFFDPGLERLIQRGQLLEYRRSAGIPFIVNVETGDIWIGMTGHVELIQAMHKGWLYEGQPSSKISDQYEAGIVIPSKSAVVFTSGTIRTVAISRQRTVLNKLEKALGMDLNIYDYSWPLHPAR